MNATIELPLNLLLIVIGSFLCVRLTIFLLTKRSVNVNSNIILGILVFILGFQLIVACLGRFELLENVPHLIGIPSFLHFLPGPLTYFYVKASTQKGFQYRPLMLLHLLPFLIEIFLNVPFFMESAEYKLGYYKDFVEKGRLFPYRILYPLKVVHSIVYLSISVKMTLHYRDNLSNATSYIDNAFHRWLLLFVFGVSLPFFLTIYVGFAKFDPSVRFLFFILAYVLFFLSIDLAILWKPELFHTFPHQTLMPESLEIKKQKYESSSLEESQKNKYLNQLSEYLKTQEPYKESELSLNDLSNQIDIPSHYLSQVINEKLGTNFLDLINQYRVEDAQVHLADPEKSHFTIMAIAYDSGFNSKSTFYAAFKKHAGMTPSEYRKRGKRW